MRLVFVLFWRGEEYGALAEDNRETCGGQTSGLIGGFISPAADDAPFNATQAETPSLAKRRV